MTVDLGHRLIRAQSHRKDVLIDLVRRPSAPELRWHQVQLTIRVAFLAGWFIVSGSTLALSKRLSSDAFLEILGFMVVIGLFWLLLALLPRRTIRITGNVVMSIASLAAVILGHGVCPPRLEEPEGSPTRRHRRSRPRGGLPPSADDGQNDELRRMISPLCRSSHDYAGWR